MYVNYNKWALNLWSQAFPEKKVVLNHLGKSCFENPRSTRTRVKSDYTVAETDGESRTPLGRSRLRAAHQPLGFAACSRDFGKAVILTLARPLAIHAAIMVTWNNFDDSFRKEIREFRNAHLSEAKTGRDGLVIFNGAIPVPHTKSRPLVVADNTETWAQTNKVQHLPPLDPTTAHARPYPCSRLGPRHYHRSHCGALQLGKYKRLVARGVTRLFERAISAPVATPRGSHCTG